MNKVEARRIQTLTGHTDCVYALAAGPTPQQFFSAGGDGMVVMWDLTQPESGALVARLPNSVYALHYLRSSGHLVAGHNYEGIHLLDPVDKKEIRSLQLTTAAIFDIQSHGTHLFVAAGDGTVTVVDNSAWAVVKKVAHSAKSARTIAINPVSGELAVGYSDHSVRIFDLDDLRLKYEWQAHSNSVFTLSYSPDSNTLLSGSRDARLKAWDARNAYSLEKEVVAHLYAINHVVFSPDGKHFVTCSLDKSIKVWDAANMTLLKVIDKARHTGHGTSVNKLLWTSFQQQLISASDDRTMGVWDVSFSAAHT